MDMEMWTEKERVFQICMMKRHMKSLYFVILLFLPLIIIFFWGVFYFFFFFSLRFLTTTLHRSQSSSSSALAIRILHTTAIPQPCSYSCPFFRPCWRWWYPAHALQRRHKGALLSTTEEDEQEWDHTQSVAEELTARLCTLQRAAEEQGSDNEGLTFRNGIHHPLLTHMYNSAAGGCWGGQGWQKPEPRQVRGERRGSVEFPLGYNNWRWDGIANMCSKCRIRTWLCCVWTLSV